MANRLNILFIDAGMTGGGSAESLYQHLTVLDQDKYSPFVIFLNPSNAYSRIEQLGVPSEILYDWFFNREFNERYPRLIKWVSRIQYLFEKWLPRSRCPLIVEQLIHLRSRKQLKTFLVENNIDLVHTNNQIHRDFFLLAAARQLQIPCVAHLRSFHSAGFTARKAQFVNQHIQAVVAYSAGIADHWLEKGLTPTQLQIVHNGIGSITALPLNLYRQFKIPEKGRTIAIIGRIIPSRNYKLLFAALKKLCTSRKDIFLLVVGDGELDYLSDIKSLATVLGLRNNVCFVGHFDDAKRIIASVDVLVLPYRIEPFGRTLLEAWQLGTPVVLSTVGSIKKIVQDRVNALLFDPESSEECALALESALFDNNLRKRLTRNGLITCKQCFSIQSYAEKMDRIYRRVM